MSPEQMLGDRKLAKYVNRELQQVDPGQQSRVTAKVSGGNVQLTGIVDDDHQRRSILRSIRRIRGVRRVIGELRVEPELPALCRIEWSSI